MQQVSGNGRSQKAKQVTLNSLMISAFDRFMGKGTHGVFGPFLGGGGLDREFENGSGTCTPLTA